MQGQVNELEFHTNRPWKSDKLKKLSVRAQCLIFLPKILVPIGLRLFVKLEKQFYGINPETFSAHSVEIGNQWEVFPLLLK